MATPSTTPTCGPSAIRPSELLHLQSGLGFSGHPLSVSILTVVNQVRCFVGDVLQGDRAFSCVGNAVRMVGPAHTHTHRLSDGDRSNTLGSGLTSGNTTWQPRRTHFQQILGSRKGSTKKKTASGNLAMTQHHMTEHSQQMARLTWYEHLPEPYLARVESRYIAILSLWTHCHPLLCRRL